jgi:hypothetical protein
MGGDANARRCRRHKRQRPPFRHGAQHQGAALYAQAHQTFELAMLGRDLARPDRRVWSLFRCQNVNQPPQPGSLLRLPSGGNGSRASSGTIFIVSSMRRFALTRRRHRSDRSWHAAAHGERGGIAGRGSEISSSPMAPRDGSTLVSRHRRRKIRLTPASWRSEPPSEALSHTS